MADPRYRRLPVIGSDGIVRRVRVNRDNLGSYGKVIINAHGKIAYQRISSDVRALEVVRGTGRRLVRVKVAARIDYKPSRKAERERFRRAAEDGNINVRRASPLKQEIVVQAVMPESDVEAFVSDFAEWRQGVSNDSYGGLDVVVGQPDVLPAEGSRVGFERIAGRTRGKEHPEQLQRNVEAWVQDRLQPQLGTGAAPAPPERKAALLRAKRAVDKNGRAYWFDPVTGRRTLDPSLLRDDL